MKNLTTIELSDGVCQMPENTPRWKLILLDLATLMLRDNCMPEPAWDQQTKILATSNVSKK